MPYDYSGMFDIDEWDSVASILADGVPEHNGRTQIDPADNVQQKVREAGKGATLEFSPGTYDLQQTVTPLSNQTWLVGYGSKFRPTGDFTAFDFSGIIRTSIGPLWVEDPNANTTSVPLVKVDNTRFNYFEGFNIRNPYNGIEINAANGAISESWFGWIRVKNARNRGMRVRGETHDNHFGGVFLDGQTGSADGFVWNTSGVDGGNVFNGITVLAFDGVGVSLDGGQLELWIDTLITDGNGNTGLYMGPSAAGGLYIDTLWSSTNGNNGVELDGSSTTTLRDIQISQWYSYNNTNYGGLFNGYIEDFQIGIANLNNNDQGASGLENLKLAGSNISHGHFGTVISRGANGVSGPGIASDVHIGREMVRDGLTATHFTTINGDPMPEDLTARTGAYDGERAYHNGTDGTNTNSEELAQWNATNSEWRGLYSGTVIA